MKSSFPLFLGLLTVIASRALGMQYDTAASRKWYEDNLKPMAGGGGYHRNVDRHTKQYKWEKGGDCSHYFLGGQIAANPHMTMLSNTNLADVCLDGVWQVCRRRLAEGHEFLKFLARRHSTSKISSNRRRFASPVRPSVARARVSAVCG